MTIRTGEIAPSYQKYISYLHAFITVIRIEIRQSLPGVNELIALN